MNKDMQDWEQKWENRCKEIRADERTKFGMEIISLLPDGWVLIQDEQKDKNISKEEYIKNSKQNKDNLKILMDFTKWLYEEKGWLKELNTFDYWSIDKYNKELQLVNEFLTKEKNMIGEK